MKPMANNILIFEDRSYPAPGLFKVRPCSDLGRYAIATFLLILLICSSAFAEPFTPEQKANMQNELHEQIQSSEGWAQFNQGWDISFKVALLVIGILSTVGATLAGAVFKQSSPVLLTVGKYLGRSANHRLNGLCILDIQFSGACRII
jgi:hypothetical protein